jgi:hypothetical protein
MGLVVLGKVDGVQILGGHYRIVGSVRNSGERSFEAGDQPGKRSSADEGGDGCLGSKQLVVVPNENRRVTAAVDRKGAR